MRDDQRRSKADFGILASDALPKNIQHFHIEGDICVTGIYLAPAIASILRRNLIELASKQATAIDRTNKKERLYDYVSSTQFRQKVQAIAEPLVSMLHDLNEERFAMQKRWDKREQEIKSAAVAIYTAYGDMQGIMGAMALPEMEVLQLPTREE